MTKFEPATLPPSAYDPHWYITRFNVSMREAIGMAARVASDSIFMNDTYQVNVSKPFRGQAHGWPDFIHLSIKRIDKSIVRDWRDLQHVKNELVGPEYEAMEIFPAESRLVDCANQFHLWVFLDQQFRIPMGWTTRMVGNAEEAERVGAVQRA